MGPIEIVARLKANSDDMVAGFRRASNAANQLNSNVSNAGSGIQRSFSMISRFAMVGAGAMQTAAMAGAAMGLRTSMANEQAIISFKTLLGTQEQASAMFKELQQFAATTPFEFPQLRDAASKLLTTGVEAERVIPIMTALGDSTAAMGTGAEGIQRAVYALQQMNLAGRITGQDMMQLANAGIPAWDALASAAGMSVAEVKKAVEKGTLQDSVPMLMSGIEKYSGAAMTRVKGMMAEQSQTLTGMMSTLKDEINIALSDMMQPAVAGIKSALPGITSLVKDTFAGMTQPINALVAQLVTAFQQLLPALQPITQVFSGLMVATLGAIVPLFTNLVSILPQLTPAFDSLAGIITNLAEAFGPLITQVAQGFVPVINTLADVIERITGFMNDNKGAIEVLTPVVAGLAAAYVAYNAAMKIAMGFQVAKTLVTAIAATLGYATAVEAQAAATTQAAAAQTGLNVAMTLNPIGLIVAAIAALVVAIVVMYKKFEWFRNGIKTIWNFIVDAVQWAINKILGYWEGWINFFIKGINLLIGAWNKLPWGEDIPLLKEVNLQLDITGAKLKTATDNANALNAALRPIADKAGAMAAKEGGIPTKTPTPKPPTGPTGAGTTAAGADKLKKKLEALRKQIKNTYEDGISKAEDRLKAAKEKQDQYTTSVSEAIRAQTGLSTAFSTIQMANEETASRITELTSSVADAIRKTASFTAILQKQKEAQDAVAQATEAQKAAQETVAEKQKIVNDLTAKYARTRVRADRIKIFQEIKDATADLTEAQTALNKSNSEVMTTQEAAAQAGSGFLDSLAKQVKAAEQFAQQITQLRALGLNESNLRQVIEAGAESGGTIATELLKGGADAIARANILNQQLEKTALVTGTSVAESFAQTGATTAAALLNAMQTKAEEATKFADRIKTLVQMGLNEANLSEVLNAGSTAGLQIADALIGGGDSTIRQANAFQQDLKNAADAAAKQAGQKYYDAGVTLANEILAGLKAQWEKVKPTLGGATLPQLETAAGVATRTVSAALPEASPVSAPTAPVKSRQDYIQEFLAMVNRQFPTLRAKSLADYYNATKVPGMAAKAARQQRWTEWARANNVPALAKGGFVTNGPVLSLVGERGPEAVMPLNRLPMSGGNTYNITIEGSVGMDMNRAGRELVAILQEYERRNGRVPLKAVR